MIPELISRFVDTGMARYVYRDFPLSSHPNAQKASEAAACAGLQDSFWEMNERLFAEVDDWGQAVESADSFKVYAAELGLDQEAEEREALNSQREALEAERKAMEMEREALQVQMEALRVELEELKKALKESK